MKKIISRKRLLIILGIFLLWSVASCKTSKGWKFASRESANIAPKDTTDAIVQIYAAAAWGMRGWLADHTWIATKKVGDESYKVYEVVGWNKYRGKDSLRITSGPPDRFWYGSPPKLLFQLRGMDAEPVVDKVEKFARRYPYKEEYTMLPGPNSNTFTEWMICHIPEINLKLSNRAIGKGYVKNCPN